MQMDVVWRSDDGRREQCEEGQGRMERDMELGQVLERQVGAYKWVQEERGKGGGGMDGDVCKGGGSKVG